MESTGDLRAAGERLILELDPKEGTELRFEMLREEEVAERRGGCGAVTANVWGDGSSCSGGWRSLDGEGPRKSLEIPQWAKD